MVVRYVANSAVCGYKQFIGVIFGTVTMIYILNNHNEESNKNKELNNKEEINTNINHYRYYYPFYRCIKKD